MIDVDNPEQKLYPGMTADVSILVARRDAVLTVSNAALRFIPPEDAAFASAESTPAPALARSQRTVYLASDRRGPAEGGDCEDGHHGWS